VQHFLDILLNITLPLVVVVVIGWATQIRLQLSLDTLKSFQLNIVLPCFFIHYISTAELPLITAWPVSWFTVLQFGALLAIGWGMGRALRLSSDVLPIFAIALAFPNTGNYGVPLATLVFTPDYLLHQAVIVAVQTVLIIFACHIFLARDRSDLASALRAVALSPMIWGMALGLLLRQLNLTLPGPLAIPTEMLGATYAAIALFTLGASLQGTTHQLRGFELHLIVWAKLLLGPAITLALAWACGFTGEDLVFLVIAASAPVGVLLAIFCLDHRGESRVASAAVFLSTILSPLTITAWLIAMRMLVD